MSNTTSRNKFLITNSIFLIGIIVLFLNDHYFKFQFANFITGKLSDIVGVIIFPFLIAYIFPKLKENSIYPAGIIFTFWKSEYSQGLLNFYNQISPFETTRVIDYTDLIALLFLPIPFWLIKNSHLLQPLSFKIKYEKLTILLPTLLILCSEAPPLDFYYSRTNGNLQCYKCKINVDYNTKEVITKLERNGIKFDSIRPLYIRGVIDSASYFCYKKELIIDKDTLRDIDISLISSDNKSMIYFNGMNVPEELTDKKLKKKLKKYYRKLIFSELKNNLKLN